MPALWKASINSMNSAGVPKRLVGAIQAGGLVTPGAVEGMFHHRQQFDMGEAHVGAIGRQLLGQIAVGEPILAVRALLAP